MMRSKEFTWVSNRMLAIEDIHVYYGDSCALQGVSLEIREGELVALIGRNGAGKTTTLRAVMGLTRPRSGRVLFKNADITDLPPFEIARRGIGYVPQGRRLFPGLTVLENLKTGCRGRLDKGLLRGIFQLFPILEARLNQTAGTLSGGEQQMLSVARALITAPDLLLMDEPTTGLMPILVTRLKEVIRDLNKRRITILLVEQKVPLALELSDRVYIMEKGQIRYSGKPEELKQKEDILLRHVGVKA